MEQSTLKLKGSIVKQQCDELVCVVPHCIQQKQCTQLRNKRPQQLFSMNSFPQGSPVLCQNGNNLFSHYSQPTLAFFTVTWVLFLQY